MFYWDEENIRWMEEAAAYTGHYQKLSNIILPYLKRDDTVCEIGCGLGHLACVLAPKVAHVTAVDISDLAVSKLKERVAANNITNLTPVFADWSTWMPQEHTKNGKFDVVLLSYFSAIKRNWPQMLKLADRSVIAVLANGESGNKMACKQYNPIYEDKEGRETVLNVIPFLRNEKIPYELIKCDTDYGQPVRSLEDAYNYVARYYLGDEKVIKEYLQENLVPLENGYYLPKLKKSGIIIIDINKFHSAK